MKTKTLRTISKRNAARFFWSIAQKFREKNLRSNDALCLLKIANMNLGVVSERAIDLCQRVTITDFIDADFIAGRRSRN